MDDLVKRLRAEVVLEQLPPFTVIIDGKETVCDGGKVVQSRNPDGNEAADRIEALEAERDRLAAELAGVRDSVIEEAANAACRISYNSDHCPEMPDRYYLAEELRTAIRALKGHDTKGLGDGQG